MSENSAELINRFRAGDATAADAIWQRYTNRLLALARARLSPRLARRVDASDVLQSTYRSFFSRVQDGELTVAHDGDLWRLLSTIVIRKLGRQSKHHHAAKRSLAREAQPVADEADSLADLAGREPSPADVVAAAEELHWLLDHVGPDHRAALELRLRDLTIDEVATQTGRSERTIRRWLAEAKQMLAERWSAGAQSAGARASHATWGKDGPSESGVAALSYNDYRIKRLIGSGGVCKVYVAVEAFSGRRVAMKVLRKRLANNPRLVDHFLREAEIVSRFSHPNIVPVHGLGRFPDGGHFMVMEYIDGHDLSHIPGRDLLPVQRAMQIVATVAEAVHYAHAQGVVHRDLKPGNVLIDQLGRVFVTDFGFAWLQAEDVFKESTIVGTAPFMAPEQIDRRWGAISQQTDVYGLGALLFVLLYGRPPIAGNSNSVMLERIVADDVIVIPHCDRVPDAISDICRRCLQKLPAGRYENAHAVAAALSTKVSLLS